VLVDQELRKCVTFLYVRRDDPVTGEVTPAAVATTFLVAFPVDRGYFEYAVTVRHVIDASRQFGSLYLRLNRDEGGIHDVEVPQDQWMCHPNTDAAVAPLDFEPGRFDHYFIPFDMLPTDEAIAAQGVGEGDEVFCVGLFTPHPGSQRTQPIVRFGHVSLMPYEKMNVRLSPGDTASSPVDAYLVEAHSWGGQSGSPAFVYLAPHRHPGRLVIGGGPRFLLLGVVHGHHEIHAPVDFSGDVLGTGKVPISAGVAIVVPAQKIIDVIMGPELAEERSRQIEA
jgi:hypothetical protein